MPEDFLIKVNSSQLGGFDLVFYLEETPGLLKTD